MKLNKLPKEEEVIISVRRREELLNSIQEPSP